jgi:hypothetical protein
VSATANTLHATNPARPIERFVAFIVCSLCDDFIVMRMGRRPFAFIRDGAKFFLQKD